MPDTQWYSTEHDKAVLIGIIMHTELSIVNVKHRDIH